MRNIIGGILQRRGEAFSDECNRLICLFSRESNRFYSMWYFDRAPSSGAPARSSDFIPLRAKRYL